MPGQFGVINPFHHWKKTDGPCDPSVSIALNHFGRSGDAITVAIALASESEIDFAIDQLKKDLETVRKQAKRVLKSQREKIDSSIGKPPK